ncbi:G5 domain-containing protein [Actinoplanes sp. NPDC023801]|uniref:G5 domain-containing protein n=1 Tax=Actinoplanes sp. NPDC023801 TaxID=3154595 RepID=UPI0033F8B930
MPRKSWWARLPFGVRMAAGASAMFVVVGGGVAGAVSTMTSPGSENVTSTAPAAEDDLGAPMLEESPEVVSRAAAAAEPLPARPGEIPVTTATTPVTTATRPVTTATTPAKTSTIPAPARTAATADHLSRARVADQRADRTGPRPARTLAQAPARRKAAAEPVVTTRTDVETRAVPFDTQVVRDPLMPRGTRQVRVAGSPGVRTLRYLVTMTDGRPTARRLLSSAVTRKPQNRVVALGSARKYVPEPVCDEALGLCLPFGRTAVCPSDGSADPVTAPPPAAVPVRETGEILISEKDLELLGPEGLDAVRLEPAAVC